MNQERKRLGVLIACVMITAAVVVALGCAAGWFSAGSLNRSGPMGFEQERCYMITGEQINLWPAVGMKNIDGEISWSNSDASVVVVDSAGTVTALSEGTAVITVLCGEISDSVTVTVIDDIMASAERCIKELSEGCDAYKLTSAKLLADKFGNWQNKDAENARNIINNIIACTQAGNRESLDAAINAAEMDADLCRTAAVCCWAYGEQLACDGVLSFVGDCTLARYNESSGRDRFPSVYSASDSLTYPFDRVKGVFSCDDLTVINFEGTLTDSTAHYDKSFYFRGAPEYAKMLPASSIEVANLANNHSYDYYSTGFDDTVRNLSEAGVSVISSGVPLYPEIGRSGINVVLIAETSGSVEYTEEMHRSIIAAIKESKNSDSVVIVNLHWGVETSTKPSEWQVTAAHELIDAGADLIVGHHPHVLQGIEIYNEKYIAYSLGNFAFGGNSAASSPQTVILRARLGLIEGEARVTGISVLPCYTTSSGTSINNYQPMLCFGIDGDEVYSLLMERSEALGAAPQIDRPCV